MDELKTTKSVVLYFTLVWVYTSTLDFYACVHILIRVNSGRLSALLTFGDYV